MLHKHIANEIKERLASGPMVQTTLFMALAEGLTILIMIIDRILSTRGAVRAADPVVPA
jgi:hypothetical protein